MNDFDHIQNCKLLRGSHTFPGPTGGTCNNETTVAACGFGYCRTGSLIPCRGAAPTTLRTWPQSGSKRCPVADSTAMGHRFFEIGAPKFDKLAREGQMPQPFRKGSLTIYDLRKLDAVFDELSGLETLATPQGAVAGEHAATSGCVPVP